MAKGIKPEVLAGIMGRNFESVACKYEILTSELKFKVSMRNVLDAPAFGKGGYNFCVLWKQYHC